MRRPKATPILPPRRRSSRTSSRRRATIFAKGATRSAVARMERSAIRGPRITRRCAALHPRYEQQKPPAVRRRGLRTPTWISRSRIEVALDAEHGSPDPEVGRPVLARWLAARAPEVHVPQVRIPFLFDLIVEDFEADVEILHRVPDRPHPDGPDVEVGIAARGDYPGRGGILDACIWLKLRKGVYTARRIGATHSLGAGRYEIAERQLGRGVEANMGECAVDRGAHRRRPVVLVGGGNRPHRSQLQTAEDRVVRRAGIEEHRIRYRSGRDPVVAHDEEGAGRRIQLRSVCVARRTLGIDALDIDLVALAEHRKVDAGAGHEREAVFVFRLHTSEGGVARDGVVAVIAGRDLMGRHRNLRGTPGLADIELADEVRQLLRGIVADRATGQLSWDLR